jgi:hypothetical protein
LSSSLIGPSLDLAVHMIMANVRLRIHPKGDTR